jgi:hypothetical protein
MESLARSHAMCNFAKKRSRRKPMHFAEPKSAKLQPKAEAEETNAFQVCKFFRVHGKAQEYQDAL